MTISKDFRFPVSVSWPGHQLACARAPGVEKIEIAVPPEFNGPSGYWSPEQLLVASAASCFAVTFAAVAKQRGIPINSLNVSGTGHIGHRDDGRTGFVAVELTPRIETEPDCVAAAERTARACHCLVTEALDVPVHVIPLVTAVAPVVV